MDRNDITDDNIEEITCLFTNTLRTKCELEGKTNCAMQKMKEQVVCTVQQMAEGMSTVPSAPCIPELEAATKAFLSTTLAKTWESHCATFAMTSQMQIKLDLSHNEISCKGVKCIADVLKCSSLIELDLQNNQIGHAGAEAIALALPASSLLSLNLNSNDIGDEGGIAIAAALSNSPLACLKLSESDINYEGIKAIATALPLSALTRLEVIIIWTLTVCQP